MAEKNPQPAKVQACAKTTPSTPELEDQAANLGQTTAAEKKGTSRTLYFTNSNDIQALVNHLKNYPRANLSSVFGQVVQPLNAKLAKLQKDHCLQRSVDLTVKIWL